MIGATTRTFALLGDPVGHSLSPVIQNAAFTAAGVDGVYVALRCSEGDAPGLVGGLARAGGGGNVTLPHKEVAAGSVDEPSERVVRTGACNTFWLEDGRIRGDNTDVAGFLGAVEALLGRRTAGLRVLLLGAGGAARASLVGLIEDDVGDVAVWNRTPERAEQLVRELGGGRARVVASPAVAAERPLDLVVNTTSLGLRANDPLPVDPGALGEVGAVLDLAYRPDETGLVRRARELGIPSADGGEMLVRQGAEAFRLWWRRPPPLEEMRAALDRVRAVPSR